MNESITKVCLEGKEIYLIGTAHVSHTSSQDVKNCVETVQPDSICIELDQERYNSLKNPNRWLNTDIIDVIKQKKAGFMLANLILGSYQKRIAKKINVQAGQEMIQGIQSAEETQAELVLADRSIQTTFTRIYRKLRFLEKFKLLTILVLSIFEEEEITEEEIENLKQSEILEAALQDVGKDFPVVSDILIHERDQTLAYHIKNAPGKKVVAVLGAAHIPGVKKELFKNQDIAELTSIPQKKASSKLIKWIIPILLIGMILSMFSLDPSLGWQQLLRWTLWNGSLSAIGVLLAWGHPLSILTAFLASPITSLNPLLAAGWFAGLSEAFLRKPKVRDFENLLEDLTSFKGFYKNRVTHILLVVILANLFSTLGTLIGGIDILKTFFQSFL